MRLSSFVLNSPVVKAPVSLDRPDYFACNGYSYSKAGQVSSRSVLNQQLKGCVTRKVINYDL